MYLEASNICYSDSLNIDPPPKVLYPIELDYFTAYWDSLIMILKHDKEWSNRLYRVEVKYSVAIHDVVENLIMLYWWCSTTGLWEWFEFDEVAYALREFLEGRVVFYKLLIKYSPSATLTLRKAHKDAVKHVRRYRKYMPLQEKIAWFDTLIHMEHQRGSVLAETNLNVSTLRDYFDAEYNPTQS